MGGVCGPEARGSGEDCLMRICDDLPELVAKISEINFVTRVISHFFSGHPKESWAASEQLYIDKIDGDDERQFEHVFQRPSGLVQEVQEKIFAHQLSEEIIQHFLQIVDQDLNNTNLLQLKVSIHPYYGFHLESGEWINRTVWGARDLFEMHISYALSHTKLIEVAKEHWKENERVEIIELFDKNEVDQTRQNQSAQLAAHGIPCDFDEWWWACEALDMVDLALKKIGYAYKLCDLVQWTCSNIHEIGDLTTTYGPQIFYREAHFGNYHLEARAGKESCAPTVWFGSAETLIGPFWEYLAFTAHAQPDQFSLYHNLGLIGEGLDSAIKNISKESIPENADFKFMVNEKLTNHRIFESGQSVMRLKMQLELSDTVDKGRRAEITEQTRAKRGGERSSEARGGRVKSLLLQIEKLAESNPAFSRLDPETRAMLAVEDAAKDNPAIWAQGRKQAQEYLGEIRRGEAGADLRARYEILFPPKPPKRSGR